MIRETPQITKLATPAHQRGLALVMVLWAAVLLALVAGSVARLSRGDLNLSRNLIESTEAELAADSALWTAVHAIVNGGPDAWRIDGTVYAWRFGEAEVRVRVTDELGRIDINVAPPELLAALFVAAGTEPEEATRLAEAAVEYRSPSLEAPSSGGAVRPSGGPATPFALIDELEQVPGLPPGLQRRIADAISVYTGQARPRSGATSPLVLAAVEGSVLDEAGAEPGDAADSPPTDEPQVLGDSPAVLGAPTEPTRVRSGLLHIEAEAVGAGGAHFAREAVIALQGRGPQPYRLRLWRRGTRVLFPAP